MEIKNRILLLALLITFILLFSILLIGTILDQKRSESLDGRFEAMYSDMNDIQKLTLLSEAYGNEMACLAFKSKLNDLDKKIWDLGIKLEQYRIASEEFEKNPYYLEQKKVFNENQLTYMAMLKKISEQCEYEQTIISFFYRKSDVCKKCDDQSFVLSDINREFGDEVSIFSYDLDLDLETIELLKEYYKVDELPCIVINEETYCGIRSRDFIMKKAGLFQDNETENGVQESSLVINDK